MDAASSSSLGVLCAANGISPSRCRPKVRDGNMSKAARLAGIDRTTLYRLMDNHDLQRDESGTGE